MSIKPESSRPQRVLRQVPQQPETQQPPINTINNSSLSSQQQQQQQQRQPNQSRLSFGRQPIMTASTSSPNRPVGSSPMITTPLPTPISTLPTPSTIFSSSQTPRQSSKYALPNPNPNANPNPNPNPNSNPIPITSTKIHAPASSTTTNRSQFTSINNIPFTSVPNYQQMNPQQQLQQLQQQSQQEIAQLQQNVTQVQQELHRFKTQYNLLQTNYATQQTSIHQLELQLQTQLEHNNQLISQQSQLKELILEDILQYFESHGLDVITFQQSIEQKFRPSQIHSNSNFSAHPNSTSSPLSTITTTPYYSCNQNSSEVQSALEIYRQNAQDIIVSAQSTSSLLPQHSEPSNNAIELSQQLDDMIIELGGATREEYHKQFAHRLHVIDSIYPHNPDEEMKLEVAIQQFDHEFSAQLKQQYQQQCDNYILNYLTPIGLGLGDTTLQSLPNETKINSDINSTHSSPYHPQNGFEEHSPLMYYHNEEIPEELLSSDLISLCDKLTQIEQEGINLFHLHENLNGNKSSSNPLHEESFLQKGQEQGHRQTHDFRQDGDFIHQKALHDLCLDDMESYLGLDKPPVPH